MRVSRLRLLLRLSALLGLSGCTVGPDFHPPTVAAPSSWGQERGDVAGATSAAPVDPLWWRSFHDPELSSLIGRLAAQNLDLREAAERIEQGRAQRRIAAAQGLPHLDAQSSLTHQRMSPTGFISLVTPAPGANLDYDDWKNGLSASWELDLFGRVRRDVEASRADLQVQIEDRRGLALSALSELAQDYLQLRGVQARLSIAETTLTLAQRNTDLVVDRLRNGVATTLDIAQARAQQAAIAGTLPPLRTEQAALVNAIGLLLAEPPRALGAELAQVSPVPPIPASVPVGVPATLVRRRPDVRSAEAALHAATARTGVAVAAFYPDIALTGMVDADGRLAVNAFSLPSRAYSLGPQISIPLFEGGQLRGQLQLRKAQQREAAIAFQRTVLRAWTEVDDALTAYAEAQRARQDIVVAEQQDEAALSAARQRYQQGASDFLNVITAQSQLLQARNDLSMSDTRLATDLVVLYRALGGGWQAAEPAGTALADASNPS